MFECSLAEDDMLFLAHTSKLEELSFSFDTPLSEQEVESLLLLSHPEQTLELPSAVKL